MPEYKSNEPGSKWERVRAWGTVIHELKELQSSGKDVASFRVRGSRSDEARADEHPRTRSLFGPEFVEGRCPPSGTSEAQAGLCALVFPWGEVPVTGTFGIGREAGFSSISQELDAYPGVSRQHAVVAVAEGRWTVRDHGSTNGTYVNGARLADGETRPIANGNRVGFSRGLQVEVRVDAAGGADG